MVVAWNMNRNTVSSQQHMKNKCISIATGASHSLYLQGRSQHWEAVQPTRDCADKVEEEGWPKRCLYLEPESYFALVAGGQSAMLLVVVMVARGVLGAW